VNSYLKDGLPALMADYSDCGGGPVHWIFMNIMLFYFAGISYLKRKEAR
jgi:hypothetical protein